MSKSTWTTTGLQGYFCAGIKYSSALKSHSSLHTRELWFKVPKINAHNSTIPEFIGRNPTSPYMVQITCRAAIADSHLLNTQIIIPLPKPAESTSFCVTQPVFLPFTIESFQVLATPMIETFRGDELDVYLSCLPMISEWLTAAGSDFY